MNVRITKDQRVFGGGIAVRTNENGAPHHVVPSAEAGDIEIEDYQAHAAPGSPTTVLVKADYSSDVDLGSTYAAELGFDSSRFKKYVEEVTDEGGSSTPASGGKKKKKGKKGKKK